MGISKIAANIFIFDKGNVYEGNSNDVKNILLNKTGFFIQDRGDTFVKSDLGKHKEVEIIGNFNDLIRFMSEHYEDKKFAIWGISRATAGSILTSIERFNKQQNQEEDNLEKLYNVNNLFVANIEQNIYDKDLKYIFEKLEIEGKTYYKNVFTGELAAKDNKLHDIATITLKNTETLKNVLPKLKNADIPEIVLVWAYNLINYPKDVKRTPNIITKL